MLVKGATYVVGSSKYQLIFMKYHHNWIGFDGQKLKFPGYKLIPNENKYTLYIESRGDGNLEVGQANICIAVKAMFFGVMHC